MLLKVLSCFVFIYFSKYDVRRRRLRITNVISIEIVVAFTYSVSIYSIVVDIVYSYIRHIIISSSSSLLDDDDYFYYYYYY